MKNLHSRDDRSKSIQITIPMDRFSREQRIKIEDKARQSGMTVDDWIAKTTMDFVEQAELEIKAAMPLEAYKQASRDELEGVVEKFARIEQAADLLAGSLVQGLLSSIGDADADEVISHIEDGYELKAVPEDWQDRVRTALAV
jgi:hypothetical protein